MNDSFNARYDAATRAADESPEITGPNWAATLAAELQVGEAWLAQHAATVTGDIFHAPDSDFDYPAGFPGHPTPPTARELPTVVRTIRIQAGHDVMGEFAAARKRHRRATSNTGPLIVPTGAGAVVVGPNSTASLYNHLSILGTVPLFRGLDELESSGVTICVSEDEAFVTPETAHALIDLLPCKDRDAAHAWVNAL